MGKTEDDLPHTASHASPCVGATLPRVVQQWLCVQARCNAWHGSSPGGLTRTPADHGPRHFFCL